MEARTQDAYNEWLIKYGYRTITFSEAYCDGMIKWVDKLKAHNALIEVFNSEKIHTTTYYQN